MYKEFEKINHVYPDLMKIVRLKNRLDQETKDILLNLVYKKKFLIEIQLSIKSENSKFIENSNKFCHYIY